MANEADRESRYIGRIDIRDDYSLVDLPEGMPRELLEHLERVYVSGQSLKMRRADDADTGAPPPRGNRPFAGKPRAKPQIGRAPSEIQSLMRSSYAVFCLTTKKTQTQ